MTAKQVINEAARLIGIDELLNGYFTNGNEEGEKAAQALLSCLYLVETELASEYFPLRFEETLTSNGKIEFEAFTHKPLCVLSVADSGGKEAAAVIFPTYIKVKNGAYNVSYTYAPDKKELDDDLPFDACVTAALVAYGVAAEYCLLAGLYEEAAVWEKKYKQAIRGAKPKARGGAMRAREWN